VITNSVCTCGVNNGVTYYKFIDTVKNLWMCVAAASCTTPSIINASVCECANGYT